MTGDDHPHAIYAFNSSHVRPEQCSYANPVHSRVDAVSAGLPTHASPLVATLHACFYGLYGVAADRVGLGWVGLLQGFNGLKPAHWLAGLGRAFPIAYMCRIS